MAMPMTNMQTTFEFGSTVTTHDSRGYFLLFTLERVLKTLLES